MRVFKQTNKQIDMKNKLLAVLATLGMVASASAVKINNNLSINGFIDGSWSSTDTDGAANTHDEQALGLDEVELNFIISAGNVSGEIHLDNQVNERTQGDDGNGIEQAHFSYSFASGLTAQVGRFGSALGLEREDPAGLYTFSRAYDSVTVGGNTDIFNIGNIDSNQYRVDGFRLGYNLDTVSFSVAAGNPTEAREESNNGGAAASEDNLDYEFAVSFNGLGAWYSPKETFFSCLPPSNQAAPERVSSTITSIKIEWKPPVDTGGCDILGYAVFLKDSGTWEEVNQSDDP